MLAVGLTANRLYQRRTGERDQRWLLTEQETQDLTGAIGRILTRRIPEALIEGENGDLLTIVGTAAGYVLRNALNLTEEAMRSAQEEAADLLDERRAPERATPPVPDQSVEPEPPAPAAPIVAGVSVLTADQVGAV